MPTRIADGSRINPGDLHSRRTALRTRANALTVEDVRRGTLDAVQVGTSVIWTDSVVLDGTGSDYTYLTYPYNGWATATGWGVISDGTNDLRLDPPDPIDLSDVRGVLVLADVEVKKIFSETLAVKGNVRYLAMFCIQALIGGSWEVIAKTERYVGAELDPNDPANVQFSVWRNVPIRTLIKESDLSGSHGTNLEAIRVCIACANAHNTAIDGLHITVGHGRLTAVALHAGSF